MIRRLAGQLMAAVVDHWLPLLTQAVGVDELQWVAAGGHKDNAGGGQCNTVGGAGDGECNWRSVYDAASWSTAVLDTSTWAPLG
jgi:hypothetical protein